MPRRDVGAVNRRMAIRAAGVKGRFHLPGGERPPDGLRSPAVMPGVALHAEKRLIRGQ